jgi:excisionase family DNA binding protein
MASEPEVLTVKEVCDLLRIHRSTIYRLVRQGRIPSFKIGKDWRFRKDLILRWIAEQTKGPPQ